MKKKEMKNKVIQIVRDHIKLIKPLEKNGTTTKIREHARKEVHNLSLILASDMLGNEFVVFFKDSIIKCCISLYSKLCEDSRNLPTPELRDLANDESKEVMEIWTEIES